MQDGQNPENNQGAGSIVLPGVNSGTIVLPKIFLAFIGEISLFRYPVRETQRYLTLHYFFAHIYGLND